MQKIKKPKFRKVYLGLNEFSTNNEALNFCTGICNQFGNLYENKAPVGFWTLVSVLRYSAHFSRLTAYEFEAVIPDISHFVLYGPDERIGAWFKDKTCIFFAYKSSIKTIPSTVKHWRPTELTVETYRRLNV